LKTASGVVNLAAAKKVTLAVSGGASITIEGGQLTVQCPGTLTVKASKRSMVGAPNKRKGSRRCHSQTSSNGARLSFLALITPLADARSDMIISPPYLLPRNAGETDDAWIRRCMPATGPGDGAYPLGHALQWHGGVHLIEPEANAPVRAIADGTVVFKRDPTPQPQGGLPPDHPQGYFGGWTDNGVVVIQHTTEIGEGPNASVTFFSIYMHLREIDSKIKLNETVYRKAPLGRAGSVFGETGRFHFEIVCDDVNLRRLVGRASGNLNTGANGRTDAVYGSMYFRLPADTQVYPDRPALNLAQGTGGTPIGVEVFVELRYAHGEGAAGNRGDAYLSTYQADGTRIGEPLEENDAEYITDCP